jgi:hypothetical protein
LIRGLASTGFVTRFPDVPAHEAIVEWCPLLDVDGLELSITRLWDAARVEHDLAAAGLRFATELPDHASDVEDLDGVAQFDEVRPADLVFDEDEWRARRAPAEAKQHVKRLFGARPGSVEPVMVPIWKLILRRGAGESFRVAMIDAIAGKLVEWPEPPREA